MLRILSPLLLVGLVWGCASPVIDDNATGEFAAQGLHPVKSSGFSAAYARPDANLATYKVVDVRPLGVSEIEIPQTAVAGTLRRDWEMTGERETALQTSWAQAMDRSFSAYGRATSGPGVLRVTAKLTRMAPGRPTAMTYGIELQPMGSSQDVVELWAEFRLFDEDSGRLLAVIRDSRTFTSVSMSRTAPIALESLFRSWAALLQTRVSGR